MFARLGESSRRRLLVGAWLRIALSFNLSAGPVTSRPEAKEVRPVTSEPLAGRVSAETGEPDPWRNRVALADRGGPGYAELIGATRAYLDALAAASPGSDEASRLAEELRGVTSALQHRAVDEDAAPIGTRLDLPGRGHPLLLPFVVDEW